MCSNDNKYLIRSLDIFAIYLSLDIFAIYLSLDIWRVQIYTLDEFVAMEIDSQMLVSLLLHFKC